MKFIEKILNKFGYIKINKTINQNIKPIKPLCDIKNITEDEWFFKLYNEYTIPDICYYLKLFMNDKKLISEVLIKTSLINWTFIQEQRIKNRITHLDSIINYSNILDLQHSVFYLINLCYNNIKTNNINFYESEYDGFKVSITHFKLNNTYNIKISNDIKHAKL